MSVPEHILYFDDVGVGDEAVSPGRTVTEADVARYVQLSGDWSPASTDEEFARDTEFGGRVAPDLMIPGFSSGLTWRNPRPPLAVAAFMGLEWQFYKPIQIGDTLHVRLRAMAKRKMKQGGVIIQEHAIINQHDEMVQRGKVTFLVASRPA